MITWIPSLEILVIAVVVGLATWIAIRARPLNSFPYRWGTWMAFYTGFAGFGFIAGAMIRPSWIVPPYWAVLGVLALCGSIGLFRRMRVGAVLAIGSEIGTAALNPVVLIPILSLVIVNVCYFGKRWSVLHSGVISRRPHESEPEPAVEDEMTL